MSRSLWPATAVVGLVALQAITSGAAAGGFALEQQNARALGAAFAGAQARRADPGFAAYNPTAIAGLAGPDVSVNATGVWSITSFENAQGTLFGVAPISGAPDGEDFDGDAVIPNLSIAAPLSDRIAIGLLVHAPFGLSTNFDPSSVIRYQAQKSEALSIAVSPTVAIALTDDLSIAGSVRIQYFDLSVTAIVDAGGVAAANSIPGFLPGSSDLPASFNGDDVAVGFTAGFMAALGQRVVIGGSYASKISHDIEGDAVFDLAASGAAQVLNVAAGLFAPTTFVSDFTTPAIAGLGVEISATERFTLLASTTYSRWSAFETVSLIFANLAQPPEILTQNWDDSWSLSVGGEYAAARETTLRAGFMFDDTPVNDAFASPRIPDSDRYWASVGATQNFSERLSADVGVAVAFFADRPIALSGAEPDALIRGSLAADLETTAFAASLRVRYKF
ncbi:MAG: outer membrane protein transport protein [Parvularculaceae bacterium]|nr:outer membrane protein transport protein [Parvularculaceae bacterium]